MTARHRLTALLASSLLAAGLTTAAASTPAASDETACDRIAWTGDNGTEIYVADADGADRIEISQVAASPPVTANSPAWSSDGDQIAFIGIRDLVTRLWLVDADGTDQVILSEVDAGTDPTTNGGPHFGPLGDRIVWSGHDGSTSQIWIADTDGTDRDEISSVSAGTDPTNNFIPKLSPDGATVAWFSFDDGLIYASDSDGANRFVLSDVDTGTDPINNRAPVWSPDGTKIAWHGNAGTNEVFVADADGDNRTEISNADAGSDPTNNRNPAWSPDGTRIAWHGSDGSTNQIWVADADGQNRMKISDVDTGTDPVNNQLAQWSPDGSRIAWYSVAAGGGDGGIYVADADGQNRGEIADVAGSGPTQNSAPVWRPRSSGDISLSSLQDPLTVGDHGEVELTIHAACPTTGISVSGVNVPCLSNPTRSATSGTVSAAGVWTIETLDGFATATLEGTIESTDCNGTATLTASLPTDTTPPTYDFGTNAPPAVEPPTCGTDHPFTDIADLTYGQDDIACIWNRGITTGTGDGTTYSPFDRVTRQQMGAFLARLWRDLGGACDATATPFTDIADLTYGQADIACIYWLEITTGTTGTTYSPLDDVSRWQMALFLQRLWEALGGDCDDTAPPFTDIAEFSADKQRAIACIYWLAITTGTGDGTTYSPNDFVTRQQMAAFLARLWRTAVDEGLWS